MLGAQIFIVRSRPINGSELVQGLQRVREHCRRHDFVSRTHGEIHSSHFWLRELPLLNAYKQVADVTLVSESRGTEKCGALIEMTRKTHALSAQHAWTTWHASQSKPALASNVKSDFIVSAGLRKEGCFSGVDICRPSPAADDLLARAALFQRVISEMELAEVIGLYMDADVLRMRAQEPWTVTFPSARIDKGNPSGFYASGFSDIEVAIRIGIRLVERFTKQINWINFVAKLPDHGYGVVFRDLNALSDWWSVTVLGALTPDAIGILKGGAVSSTSPPRIPAFEWTGARSWQALGSVVVENGQRYLEIATEIGSLEQLQKRVEFLEDLDFQPL